MMFSVGMVSKSHCGVLSELATTPSAIYLNPAALIAAIFLSRYDQSKVSGPVWISLQSSEAASPTRPLLLAKPGGTTPPSSKTSNPAQTPIGYGIGADSAVWLRVT